MGFTVPNAVNYSSPLNAVPLDWTSNPVEGPKGIQCSVNWGTQGGANNAVYVNCQNNATLNFSKIRALIIDNSQCGSDVEFIFPDTETTVSIPAYTPYAIIPVFTNQTQFYLVSPNAQAEDVTNFTVLNTAPPPVAVPTTQEQNFFSNGSVDIATSGNLQVVPTGVSGTLEAIAIVVSIGVATWTSGSTALKLEDGNSNTFWQGTVTAGSSAATVILAQLTDLRLRFQNGLKLVWTTSGTATGLTASVNLYYREP